MTEPGQRLRGDQAQVSGIPGGAFVSQPLTPERILEAAEEVLRRHGPAKANVVDVARALGVSHGSVYRHFPSKQALREAVTRRWLHSFHHELDPIDDLREWLHALFAAKRAKALEDPELFATYDALLAEASGVVDEHVATLVAQLTRIVGDEATARAIFQATTRFHHPAHAAEWADPDAERDLDRIIDLIAQ
jgi:AcrR family transcriptional regulator